MGFLSKPFLTTEEKEALVKGIQEAEFNTSGEIRVHLEPRCPDTNPLERAKTLFLQLGMGNTKQKNGILIYVAYEDHRFAILGDSGINAVVESHFWEDVKEVMRSHFASGGNLSGLLYAVKATGMHLKHFFPYTEGDQNELSNEISEA